MILVITIILSSRYYPLFEEVGTEFVIRTGNILYMQGDRSSNLYLVKSGFQFFDEEIVRLRVVGIAHALSFGRNKAGPAVKVYIAGNGKRTCSHFSGFFHGIVKQLLSVALPLVCGCDADGTEGHDRVGFARHHTRFLTAHR